MNGSYKNRIRKQDTRKCIPRKQNISPDEFKKKIGTSDKILILACGALAKEISILIRANSWNHLHARYLPAKLHNNPENITAQLIDSSNGMVLVTISTQQKLFDGTLGGNIEAAKKVGAEVAKKALDLGHKKVTFDRSGYKYHGRVKALADGARDGGLEF